MKLYYSKGACSLAVRIIINELKLNAEYEEVDLRTKRTATGEDFLKINPKGAVPTLITNQNEVLTENAAIQQYLADSANAVTLLPPVNDFQRYRVIEWLNFVATDLHKGFGPLFNPKVPQEIKDSIFIPILQNKFAFLDQHLQQNEFLLDSNFTLPDAYLFVVLRWAAFFKFDMAGWQHLSRYFQSLQNRDSIQQSLKEEGIK